MFYRNHNLRLAIGLLGVVLTLWSGVQQSHAFCYLAGCNSATTQSEKTEKADSIESVRCCSRSYSSKKGYCSKKSYCSRQTKSSSAESKSSAETEGVDLPNGSCPCPCPPTCWCHQSPEPLGLPTSVPASIDLLSQGFGQSLAPMVQPSCCDQGLLYDSNTTTDASIATVLLRCAKLCRFLI